jgi:spermidine synthase
MDWSNVNKRQILFFSSFLLASIFTVASCSIFYELLISTVTTYLLGSSVLHFSLTIGFFMSFMGVGAYLSRYVKEDLLFYFIKIEIALGLAGGLSCFLLHCFFAFTESFYVLTLLLIATIGVLVGLELPLLTRIIKNLHNLREALAKVLTFDYLGALIASVLFPLVLLPFLGTMQTAFLIGLINLSVALISIILFRKYLKATRTLAFFAVFAIFFFNCRLIIQARSK